MMTAADYGLLQSYFQFASKTANILASGPTTLTGPDSSRWALLFGQSDSLTSWRAFPPGVPFLCSPFRMPSSGISPVWCVFPTHGSLAQGAWQGQAQTGTGQVGWIEIYYRPPAGVPSMEDLVGAVEG